jgi:DNA-binding CsgD family transcriptional regulator
VVDGGEERVQLQRLAQEGAGARGQEPRGDRRTAVGADHQHGDAGGARVGLIEDLLNVARMDGGVLALDPGPVDADALLAEAADMLRPLAAAHGPTLEWVPAGDAPPLRDRFGLTARQMDVARLPGEGRTNHEIAEQLGVSYFTVRSHTEQVLAEPGVASRAAVGALLYGGG